MLELLPRIRNHRSLRDVSHGVSVNVIGERHSIRVVATEWLKNQVGRFSVRNVWCKAADDLDVKIGQCGTDPGRFRGTAPCGYIRKSQSLQPLT